MEHCSRRSSGHRASSRARAVRRSKKTIEELELPTLTSTGESLIRIAPGFFDPDKHPRWPGGQSNGGQFRPADDGNGPDDLPRILPVADFSGGFHDAVVDAWMDYFKEKGIPAIKAPAIRMIGPDPSIIGYPDIIVNDPRLGLPWTVFEIKTGNDPTYTPHRRDTTHFCRLAVTYIQPTPGLRQLV